MALQTGIRKSDASATEGDIGSYTILTAETEKMADQLRELDDSANN